MEDIKQDSILAFDTCFTNNHICMLKILLPCCDSSLQRYLAVYIHFLELQYTLTNFTKLSKNYHTEKPAESLIIFDKLLPYCTSKEKQLISQFRNLFDTMENLKNMMELMEVMKDMFPEGMNSPNGETGFPTDIFSTLQGMFGQGSFDPQILSVMSGMFSGENT
jgi:hypothetical protein